MPIPTVRCRPDGSETDRAEMARDGFCPRLPVRRPRDPRLRDQSVRAAGAVLPAHPRALRALRQPRHKSHRPRRCESQGGKGHGRQRRQLGSAPYGERIFGFYGETASLTLIGARRRIPFALGDHQRGQLARHAGERRIRTAQLSMKRARGKTTFFLKVEIEVECDACAHRTGRLSPARTTRVLSRSAGSTAALSSVGYGTKKRPPRAWTRR